MSNPAIPVQPAPFSHRLTYLARALANGDTARIVAIGSSTTAGEGGIPPYPGRLEAALRARYRDEAIVVFNRGIGGQDAPDELLRFGSDVVELRPTIVIWQVGTNSVWSADDPEKTRTAIRDGLDALGKLNADVILMDPQYVPALLTPDRAPKAEQMAKSIADLAAAASTPVNVFRRFAYMRAWHEVEKISFDRMLDPTDLSRLHHSDWSTQRIADALAQVMFDALALAES